MKKNTLKPRTPNLVVAYKRLTDGEIFHRRADAGGFDPVKKVPVYRATDGKTISPNENDIAKANVKRLKMQYQMRLLEALEDIKGEAEKAAAIVPKGIRAKTYNFVYQELLKKFMATHKKPSNYRMPKAVKLLAA